MALQKASERLRDYSHSVPIHLLFISFDDFMRFINGKRAVFIEFFALFIFLRSKCGQLRAIKL